MFADRLARGRQYLADGNAKKGNQELYEAIFEARDASELEAVRSAIRDGAEQVGWLHRHRYREILRVVDKHLELRGHRAA